MAQAATITDDSRQAQQAILDLREEHRDTTDPVRKRELRRAIDSARLSLYADRLLREEPEINRQREDERAAADPEYAKRLAGYREAQRKRDARDAERAAASRPVVDPDELEEAIRGWTDSSDQSDVVGYYHSPPTRHCRRRWMAERTRQRPDHLQSGVR